MPEFERATAHAYGPSWVDIRPEGWDFVQFESDFLIGCSMTDEDRTVILRHMDKGASLLTASSNRGRFGSGIDLLSQKLDR
jgi:uncharacterized protein YcsI (UPF0317 family)